MAVIHKHGEIGQIERVAYKVCYCEDGKILRNDGDGWKQWRKVKPGVNPREHFEQAKANYEAKLASKPAFSAWRELFHKYVSFKHRYLMLTAISSMPQDPDGVWSEVNDSYFFNHSNWNYRRNCRALPSLRSGKKRVKVRNRSRLTHPKHPVTKHYED